MKNTKICTTHKEFLIEGIACQPPSSQEPRSLSQFGICGGCICKEVCNGGVACSLLKIGSLEETIIASLFHSGYVKKMMSYVILGNDRLCRSLTKKE